MAKICHKCHKCHDLRRKCPSPPTLEEVQESTRRLIEQVERGSRETKNSKLHFGENI